MIKQVPYMQPENPIWVPDLIDYPIIQRLPMVQPDDGYFKRLWTYSTKRPEFIVKQDYFTHVKLREKWMWVPTNFVYDFASIPIMIPINPAGPFAYAALPHDFIYRFGGLFLSEGEGQPFIWTEFTRKEADQIFRKMSKRVNGLSFLSTAATVVLSVMGGRSFRPRDVFDVDWSRPVRACRRKDGCDCSSCDEPDTR